MGPHLRACALAVLSWNGLLQRATRPPHWLCSAACLTVTSSAKLSLTTASEIAPLHFTTLACFSFLRISYYIILINMCFVFFCLLAIFPHPGREALGGRDFVSVVTAVSIPSTQGPGKVCWRKE